MGEIDRAVVRSLLQDWLAGRMDERDVHSQSEALLRQFGWPELDPSDPRSMVVEILGQLEILNHQLITRDDVPAMLKFLETPPGQEIQGWQEWREYWDRLDLEARREELRNHPYYSA